MSHTLPTRKQAPADLRQLSDDEATARIVELRQAIMRLEVLRAKLVRELSA
jgi:ribosomal protein L29